MYEAWFDTPKAPITSNFNIEVRVENMAAANRTGNGEQKSEHLKELEDRLEEFIEMLRSVGVIAGDFQSNGQAVLNERMYED